MPAPTTRTSTSAAGRLVVWSDAASGDVMSLRGKLPVRGACRPRAYTVWTGAHRADCTDRLVYLLGCACPGHEEAPQMAVLTTADPVQGTGRVVPAAGRAWGGDGGRHT